MNRSDDETSVGKVPRGHDSPVSHLRKVFGGARPETDEGGGGESTSVALETGVWVVREDDGARKLEGSGRRTLREGPNTKSGVESTVKQVVRRV